MRRRINSIRVHPCLFVALIVPLAIPALAFPRDEYRREFRKTSALSPGRTFRIENSNGNLTLRTQSKGEVEILASIRCSAGTEAEARRYCDQIQIQVTEVSGVSVRTVYPRTGTDATSLTAWITMSPLRRVPPSRSVTASAP